MDKFWYFTLHRPPAPGAIPPGAVDVEIWDRRMKVLGTTDHPQEFYALGEVAYSEPLTAEQIADYELRDDN